jgi:hypothetical protein
VVISLPGWQTTAFAAAIPNACRSKTGSAEMASFFRRLQAYHKGLVRFFISRRDIRVGLEILGTIVHVMIYEFLLYKSHHHGLFLGVS